MHTTFSPRMAAALLDLVETIDGALTRFSERTMVPANEVTDVLLDVRSYWLEVVLSEACDHA